MIQLSLLTTLRQREPKNSVKALILEISRESPRLLLEGDYVEAIRSRYGRVVSGSNVNRRLRELQETGQMMGLAVFDKETGKKKNYKQWVYNQ